MLHGDKPMARSTLYGEIVEGEGLVFHFPHDMWVIPDKEVPMKWKRLIGLDLPHQFSGYFSACKLALDEESDVVYLISCYVAKDQPLPVHASRVRAMGGDTVPVAWPNDGGIGKGSENGSVAKQLKAEYLNLLSSPAHLVTIDGKKTSSRMAIIESLIERIQSGRFKVFQSCTEFLNEIDHYYHKDGKIPLKQEDHAIDATLKGLMMIERFGKAEGHEKGEALAMSSISEYLTDYDFYR
jgi:hypothetical protein